jgi:hypothetical protein
MKTTVTAQDGWLTCRWEYPTQQIRIARLRADSVVEIMDMARSYACCYVRTSVGAHEWEGFRASEIAELIHAGKGSIEREMGE